MKYCFYLTFQVSYDNGELAMVEVTFTVTWEGITNLDVEEARKAVQKRAAKYGTSIDGIVLVHSLKTIQADEE